MSTDLPPEVLSATQRIASPVGREQVTSEDVTGELRALLSWWQSVSAGVAPVDRTIEAPTADLADAATAMTAGVAALDRAVDAGATIVVPRVGVRHDSAARAVVAVLTRSDPPALVPQREGLPDQAWMASVTRVRDEAFRLAPERAEPLALLDGVEATAIAFVVGVLLGAAARQTPAVIDGTDEFAAALVADRISHGAKAWWICGSQSADPARGAASEHIDLARGLPLALVDDVGLGAAATLTLLRLLTAPREADRPEPA